MIIDSHVHIGYMLGFNMPEEMVLKSMEKYNIDFSLVSNIDSAEFDDNLKPIDMDKQISQIKSLNRVIKFAKDNPNKIGVVVWVKVANEKVDKELIETINNNREYIYGIKVHPYHSKTAFDHKKMEPFVELAEKLDVPIITHTGGCEEANVIHVYNMAKKYPKVNFIMAHMGLGTDNSEAIKLLGKLPNLYGDTTWVPMEHTIDAINKWGSEKILFGSDNPIDGLDTYHNNPKGEESVYVKYFNEFEKRIGTENYENVMYKNAIRLFKLNIK